MKHSRFDLLDDVEIKEVEIHKPVKVVFDSSYSDEKQEQIDILIKVASRLIEENEKLKTNLIDCHTEIGVLKTELESLRGTISLAVENFVDLDARVSTAFIGIEELKEIKADKT